jgi:hypothetical protein
VVIWDKWIFAHVPTGGILTVADDLLKNDGKKFIEMMEQLAERRMAREEDAKEQFGSNGYTHPLNGNMQPHNHTHNNGASPEEDEYDEEEEEDDDYDSQDDEYEEEEMVCVKSRHEVACG